MSDDPIILSDTDDEAEREAPRGGSGEAVGAESDCTIEDEPTLAEGGAPGEPLGSGPLEPQQVRQPSVDELRAARLARFVT